jgi:hypothetical protein
MKRWAGLVALMEKNRNAHRTLIGKCEGMRQFGRARRRWDNDIKIFLKE